MWETIRNFLGEHYILGSFVSSFVLGIIYCLIINIIFFRKKLSIKKYIIVGIASFVLSTIIGVCIIYFFNINEDLFLTLISRFTAWFAVPALISYSVLKTEN